MGRIRREYELASVVKCAQVVIKGREKVQLRKRRKKKHLYAAYNTLHKPKHFDSLELQV
jgi:hypothetical protein